MQNRDRRPQSGDDDCHHDRIHLARISSISALSVKLPDQQETKPSWYDTVVGMEHGFQVEPLREW